jgi:hypothetical protein
MPLIMFLFYKELIIVIKINTMIKIAIKIINFEYSI